MSNEPTWYTRAASSGAEKGPFDTESIVEAIREGHLKKTTLVRCEQSKTWIAISLHPDFRHLPVSTVRTGETCASVTRGVVPGTGANKKRNGIILLAFGVFLDTLLRFVPDDQMDGALLMVAVMTTIMIPAGAFLIWRGRQYTALEAMAVEQLHGGSRVLYLRPFVTDPSSVGQVLLSMTYARMVTGFATIEEQLRVALTPIGTMVALHRPDVELPTPGAVPLDPQHTDWRDLVVTEMRSSRLVVIRGGVSNGLLWELKQAIETLDPQRVLILALLKRREYTRFAASVRSALNISLPECRTRKVDGFIAFSDRWEPRFLPLKAPFHWAGFRNPYQRMFAFALRPVFESLHLEWQSPPVSSRPLALVTVGAAAVLIIGWALFALKSEGKTSSIAYPTVNPAPILAQPSASDTRTSTEDVALSGILARDDFRGDRATILGLHLGQTWTEARAVVEANSRLSIRDDPDNDSRFYVDAQDAADEDPTVFYCQWPDGAPGMGRLVIYPSIAPLILADDAKLFTATSAAKLPKEVKRWLGPEDRSVVTLNVPTIGLKHTTHVYENRALEIVDGISSGQKRSKYVVFSRPDMLARANSRNARRESKTGGNL